MPVTRQSVATVVHVVMLFVIAAWTSTLFFGAGRWIGGLLYGVAVPLIGFVQWARVRKRSDDARYAADQMVIAFFWAVLGTCVVLESSQLREQACEERCAARDETPTRRDAS